MKCSFFKKLKNTDNLDSQVDVEKALRFTLDVLKIFIGNELCGQVCEDPGFWEVRDIQR